MWSTRPLLCEGAEGKRKHRTPATHCSRRARRNTHSKWHELSQEDRSSNVSRDPSITPNRERDQGPFTLTLRRRRLRSCEGRTRRAIIVMTIAPSSGLMHQARPGKSTGDTTATLTVRRPRTSPSECTRERSKRCTLRAKRSADHTTTQDRPRECVDGNVLLSPRSRHARPHDNSTAADGSSP